MVYGIPQAYAKVHTLRASTLLTSEEELQNSISCRIVTTYAVWVYHMACYGMSCHAFLQWLESHHTESYCVMSCPIVYPVVLYCISYCTIYYVLYAIYYTIL